MITMTTVNVGAVSAVEVPQHQQADDDPLVDVRPLFLQRLRSCVHVLPCRPRLRTDRLSGVWWR